MENKKISLFWPFLLSFLVSELVVRIWTVRPFFGIGLILIFMFSLAWALAFYGITIMVPQKKKPIFVGLVLFLAAIAASTQLVYYSYFRTYLAVFSATQVGDVAHFWRDILLEIAQSAIPIILCAMVPVAYVILRSRFQNNPMKQHLKRNVFGGSLLVFVLIR